MIHTPLHCPCPFAVNVTSHYLYQALVLPCSSLLPLFPLILLQPTLLNVVPSAGAAGTSVTITGLNLNSVVTVAFGGAPCLNLVVRSSTSITCNAPNGPLLGGYVNVAGTSAGGVTSTLYGAFRYRASGVSPVPVSPLFSIPGASCALNGVVT